DPGTGIRAVDRPAAGTRTAGYPGAAGRAVGPVDWADPVGPAGPAGRAVDWAGPGGPAVDPAGPMPDVRSRVRCRSAGTALRAAAPVPARAARRPAARPTATAAPSDPPTARTNPGSLAA